MEEDRQLSLGLVPHPEVPPPLNIVAEDQGNAEMFDVQDVEGIVDVGGFNDEEGANQDAGQEKEAREPGSADSDDESDLPQKRVHTGGRKKKEVFSFIADASRRGDKVRRFGKSLSDKVNEFRVTTGAKAHFKAEYVGPSGKRVCFNAGEHFRCHDEPAGLDEVTVTEVVKKAVSHSVSSVLRDRRSEVEPSSSTPASSIYSPKKNVPEVFEKDMCLICRRKYVTDGVVLFESAWIGCAHCKLWVHANCAGFPGVSAEQVKKMPDYYCPDHVANGRMTKNVPLRYTNQPEPEQPSSTAAPVAPPKTRGRRRGK